MIIVRLALFPSEREAMVTDGCHESTKRRSQSSASAHKKQKIEADGLDGDPSERAGILC